MSTFSARFRSVCPDCGNHIEKDDDVTYSGGDVVHADKNECIAAVTGGRGDADGTCDRCWTVKSSTGACLCDDD